MTSPAVQGSRRPRSRATLCAAVALAVLLGLALQHVLRTRLDEIQSLASHDVIRARAELAGILQIVAVGVFGTTGALGVAIFLSSRRAFWEERFPPSGAWSWSAPRVVTGPQARRMARIGMGLALVLVLASLAGATLTWYMAGVLLACRAL